MAEPWTIGTLLQWTKQYFRDKGVENPRLDADVLLSSLLGKDRIYLYVHFDQPMESDELVAFREMVRRRAARVPVAYITGHREFMGMEFQVSPAVLIPRPDTEILVEAAIGRLAGVQDGVILDVGTGSGAVLIGTLSRTDGCRGVGVDISPTALEVAKANAARLLKADRATFLQADMFPPEPILFDAILSNPPYITSAEMAMLAPEVLQEPELALHGGTDGLDFYRRLVADGRRYLKPNGFMAFEVGAGQASVVSCVAAHAGWRTEKIIPDYAGIERVVVLRREEQEASNHENTVL
ncbi:MAG TPA: peptide chain release factor N(5)-glutamine methyltransferase [Negativicutes bacterium]|nr:peptide chain release factor N(5)-glutamine methyltransferase [Negativicutes bacterium]